MTMPPEHPEIAVRVISDVTAWDRLRLAWEELFRDSPTAAFCLDYDWLRLWWDIYGIRYAVGPRPLRIVTVWRGDRLIGGLPLYLGQSGGPLAPHRLGFLGTGEAEFEELCPDYLDLLHAPGEADVCLSAIAETLESSPDWDEVDWQDFSDCSALHCWLKRMPSGWAPVIQERGECPWADLTGGFDAYLSRHHGERRYQLRKIVRDSEKAGAVFELADSHHWPEYFEQLCQLHQRRWTQLGRPGCFAAPHFTAFHRELVRRWLPEGKALIARLSLNGQPLALLYGFLVGGAYFSYQNGMIRDETGRIRSPGNALSLLLIRHLANHGVTRYDLLRGQSEYKQWLTTHATPLFRLQLRRRTLRNGVRVASWAMRGAARRLTRLVRRHVRFSGNSSVFAEQAGFGAKR